MRPKDLERAGVWLRQHGLRDVEPTPLLAARLTARRRTRLATQVLLALFICVVAVVYADDRRSAAVDGFLPYRHNALLVLAAVVVGLVAVQSVLDWWVRRVDRRAGAALSRRVTHLGRLSLRGLLGWPRAIFAIVTFAGVAALGIHASTAPDSTTRYAGIVLLIGLCGFTVDRLVQLRHVLTHPVVAEDEVSLTADVIMRVEDTREAAAPSIMWSLPIASVFDTALGWWNDAWLGFVVLGAVTFALIQMRTAGSAAMARRATSAAANR